MFEQYPVDRPHDLTVLEQAMEEVHRPKLPQNPSEIQVKKAKNEEKRH